ncbi:MAG TPA: isoprenyl transferase [Lachnospiraceae bacterium]|jgi:undecaprenyl diphosphate synthase|nr:isoprenyl transferase [Lachnospiraceae bacterium]HBR04978.1 isoprenyl transferase [Lachnospiraceae bacterium]HBZ89733.1 isoprenyl transferase [Lachnospiraceae bacterium]
MAEVKNVPLHVAIIMDGNGRWAKKRFLPRTAGHAAGSKIVENICELAFNKGVKYLTVYAFSTENWKRPDSEVKTIMNLLREYLKDCIKKSTKNNMRIRVIGERSRLDEDIQNQIKELEEASKNNTGLNFTVALNYGGRDDILRAARKAAHDYKDGKIDIDAFEEKDFAAYLDTKDIPDPDLLIRTSGEFRISNYMMWQLAYSEIYVTDVLWPDFNEAELDKALAYFAARDRRFGGIKTDNK